MSINYVLVDYENIPAVDGGTFNLTTGLQAGDTVEFAVYGGYTFGINPLSATVMSHAAETADLAAKLESRAQ